MSDRWCITGLMCRGSKVQDGLRAVLVADIVEEALELVVLRGGEEDVCHDQVAFVGDGLAICLGFRKIDGVLRQVDAGVRGNTLHLKSGGKMERDFVLLKIGILKVDRLLAMRAGEGIAAAGGEDGERQKDAFAGGGAERSADVHADHEIGVLVVESEEVIGVDDEAGRKIRLKLIVEVFLERDLIAFKGFLPPAHGVLAGADNGGRAGDSAVGCERKVGHAMDDGVLVADAW